MPHVCRDPTATKDPIDEATKKPIDFRGDNGDNVGGGDAKALVQQRVGEEANSDGLTAGWDTLKDGNDSLNWPHFAP